MALSLDLVSYPAVSPDVIHKYADDPALVYDMKASAQSVDDHGIAVVTNRWGLRDREYAIEKPRATTRIAVLGDSVAFGLGVAEESLFSERLETALNAPGSSAHEVINFSVIGYNSAQEAIVLRDKILPVAPDVVLLAYCLNDDSYTDGLGDLARQMHPSSIGPLIHSKLVSVLLHRIERRVLASRVSFDQVSRLFTDLVESGARAGFSSVVVVFPHYFDDAASYAQRSRHATVRRLAEEAGLPLIDLLSAWEALDTERRRALFQPDGMHLTALGMEATTRALLEHRELFSPDESP